MRGRYIDFISAYCDSWCERCAFTDRAKELEEIDRDTRERETRVHRHPLSQASAAWVAIDRGRVGR